MFEDVEKQRGFYEIETEKSKSSSTIATIESSPCSSSCGPTESNFQGKGTQCQQPPSQQHASVDLRRTVSNVLSRVSTHLTTRSIADPPPPPPDGGLKAWTQVAMAWLVILTTWGWVNSYGAFQDYYTVTLNLPPSTVSWIGSVQNWLTFFLGMFSGRLLDAGLFMPTMFVGATIQVLGIFLMSLSTKYWQLMLTQGVLTGLGAGIFFTPAMGLLGTYFSDHRALAMGLASTGNSVGGMIYPALVQQLLPKIGFAWTARVLAFLNLACLSLVLAFMRPRLPPRKNGPIVDVSAFRDPIYALFVAGLFLTTWAIYYTFYYLPSFAREVIHFPASTATTIVIVVNGAGLIARIIPPFLADRYGQLNVVLPLVASLSIIAFAWLAVRGTVGMWVYTALYGLCSAGYQCLIPSTIAAITKDMRTFGTRLGMAFSVLSFAALTGPPIGGALLGAAAEDNSGRSFLGGTLWAAVSTMLAFCFLGAARWHHTGGKVFVKC